MKKLIYLFVFVGTLSWFSACDIFGDLDDGLSTEEVVQGLITALQVGKDSAVGKLQAKDGYWRDEAVRILLPPEAQEIENVIGSAQQYLDLLPGVDYKIEEGLNDLKISMNRAAEDAAPEAKAIFRSAIDSMSISDGWAILKGEVPGDARKAYDSTAATKYLSNQTRPSLVGAFGPKINTSLSKPLLGQDGPSTLQIWQEVTKYYNMAAPFIGKESINSDLGAYVTGKALDGVFLKVGNEEVEIRRDPYAWIEDAVGSILRKVFGSQGG